MLVLLSFGLVLLATILLVVGLLNDDGITLIYFSIGASAAAAVVLYLAFRRAKPEPDEGAGAPAPLGQDLDQIVADTTPATRPTPVAPAAPPAGEPAPAAAGGEAWTDDTDWEDDGAQFPIADYDDLSVAEIMPLLPQLYSDELDVVYEREQSTKNRSTILARLDKLKETGTEADAEEQVAPATTDVEVADDPTQVIRAPAPAPSSSVSLLDDEGDEGAFFPIADYDDLSVSQIVPLLSQLERDELEDVKAHEEAGANRKTLLAEIDRYLTGELEPFAWSDEERPAPEPSAAAPQGRAAGAAELPIAGYDDMNVADIRPLLSDLSTDELEQVLRHERARDDRKTIVGDITRRLEAADTEPAPTKAAATRSGGATRKATAKKSATKSAKKTAKRARKATKKQAAARFPIANYDELTVAEIRPRLTKLSDAQLEQVRERELTGAGRKTILNDIEGRLS